MGAHVRTKILRFLAENPRPGSSVDSYWTSYAIANTKEVGLAESTVWKVTTRFRQCECGILEPEEPTKLSQPTPIHSGSKHKRTTRTYRGGMPCKLTETGRRLAELMKKLEDERLIPTGFREQSLQTDKEFLSRIAPFTAADIEVAKKCDLVEEKRPRGYRYQPGLATVPTASSILGIGRQEEIVGYRYRIK